jgi:CheY-like chemotaxis protein
VGNLDRIRHHSADTRVRKFADNALTAAHRGAKLTAQLLAFSRTQQLSIVPVGVNELIAGMQHLLSQSIGTDIAIKIESGPGLPAALADANQLELAILNLAINARDAMPQGGTLTIATSCCPDGAIAIAVTDTGYGMPPEVAARAFDPFYTTKPAGKGTGLGLSQVYGTITQCGGRVTLDSDPGRGTTITLHLRPAGVDAINDRQPDPSVLPPGGSEKVLVVDDDADVREFLVKFLSDIGYRVGEAAGGEDALRAVRDFAPDLVIMDFAMPGLNGAEVAVALRKTCAGIPILFISGFADSEVLERAVGTAPLLRKPFRPTQLAAAVRAALSVQPAASS